MRSCARESVVSVLFIVFWIGRGRNQFASSVVVHALQRMMMSYFRYANRLPTTRGVDKNQHTQLLEKKKTLFLFSPKYISPKDPLPIFRPTRYLFPMRSSMPLEVILLLYFLMRFCDKRELVKRVWKVMEREREREKTKRIKRRIFLLFPCNCI